MDIVVVILAILIGLAVFQKRDRLDSGCLVVGLILAMLFLALAGGGAALDRDGYHSTLDRFNSQMDRNRASFCRTHPNAC